jgi:predicted amidohydrolase
MFTTGFTMQSAQFAERMDGKTVNWMISIADQFDAAITGSIIIEEKGAYFNRLLFVKPGGAVSYYDKSHLFGIGGEDKAYSKGTRNLIEQFREVNISFQICYDLRFPVWARNINNSYDLLINVANWPDARRGVWDTLLRARAIENQCYVVGVNRTGLDGNGILYLGDSKVVDPKGDLLTTMKEYKEGVAICEISLESLRKFRDKFPVYLDADRFEIKSDN